MNVVKLSLLFGLARGAFGLINLPVDGEEAIREAKYCLEALRKLSDSTIYNSLELDGIIEATAEDGIYHYNTKLKLELASPFFESGEMSETFDFVVMAHKEDGTKSFGIDTFPVMDEAAIEEHWVQKVETRRAAKEDSFRRLELEAKKIAEDRAEAAAAAAAEEEEEAAAAAEMGVDGSTNGAESGDRTKDATIMALLAKLDGPRAKAARLASSKKRLPAVTGAERVAEEALAELSLVELYAVSIGEDDEGDGETADYRRERATQFVDAFLRDSV